METKKVILNAEIASTQKKSESEILQGSVDSIFVNCLFNLQVHNGHLFTCSSDKTTRSFNIQASR